MATPRPSRLATFEYIGGTRYFLTMCCKNRRSHFHSPIIASAVSLELLSTAERYQFAVLAYSLMPDHLHALVEGTGKDADFCRFVSVLRRRTTIVTKFMCPDGLWQDGYYERVLRRTEETVKVIDYILNNPVRAGLVDRALDYPFSWSCTSHEKPRA